MSLLAYKVFALGAAALLIATKGWSVFDSILADRYQPRTFLLQLVSWLTLLALAWSDTGRTKDGEGLIDRIWRNGLWLQGDQTSPISSYTFCVATLFGVLSVFVLGHALGWVLLAARRALLELK